MTSVRVPLAASIRRMAYPETSNGKPETSRACRIRSLYLSLTRSILPSPSASTVRAPTIRGGVVSAAVAKGATARTAAPSVTRRNLRVRY